MSVDFAFLDSGTGGIPYMTYLRKRHPDASCIYLGDSANFPYGQKSEKEIIECSTKAAGLIINKFNPRVLIIACNTISVVALSSIRSAYPQTHVVGTVPAIKLASAISKNRKLGLLATEATVNNPYIKDLANSYAADCTLCSRGDPELVSFIEHKSFTATVEERRQAVLPAVNYFKQNGCDAIILACTHFLNMAEDIQNAAGEGITVVDSREGVAKQAVKVALESGVVNGFENKNTVPTVYVTGFTEKKDAEEYDVLCKNQNLKWGGKLSV